MTAATRANTANDRVQLVFAVHASFLREQPPISIVIVAAAATATSRKRRRRRLANVVGARLVAAVAASHARPSKSPASAARMMPPQLDVRSLLVIMVLGALASLHRQLAIASDATAVVLLPPQPPDSDRIPAYELAVGTITYAVSSASCRQTFLLANTRLKSGERFVNGVRI